MGRAGQADDDWQRVSADFIYDLVKEEIRLRTRISKYSGAVFPLEMDQSSALSLARVMLEMLSAVDRPDELDPDLLAQFADVVEQFEAMTAEISAEKPEESA